ncbi:hypothetical protein KNV05_gp115 [Vibrio phage River4]|uniref:Uncharacterized protein n=1 Tax=Vibrio phage River4 TaxID=2736288 RepID=A0A6M9Z229_9CAUD|nr:hypothetical protein KNV05_gp115 [Vibrio phage River4]QKN84840.1 hypothetical protein RIVER4_201 [Vibrio phage River4]
MSHIHAKKASFVTTAVLAMAAKERDLYEAITRDWRHSQVLYIGVNGRSLLVSNAKPRKSQGTDLGAMHGKTYFTIKNYGIDGMYIPASKFISPYALRSFKFTEGDLYEVSRNEFLRRLAMELHI